MLSRPPTGITIRETYSQSLSMPKHRVPSASVMVAIMRVTGGGQQAARAGGGIKFNKLTCSILYVGLCIYIIGSLFECLGEKGGIRGLSRKYKEVDESEFHCYRTSRTSRHSLRKNNSTRKSAALLELRVMKGFS